MFVNILMCDIGHVTGLSHTGEENDSMFFTEFNELAMAQKDIFLKDLKNCMLSKNYCFKNEKLSFELNH